MNNLITLLQLVASLLLALQTGHGSVSSAITQQSLAAANQAVQSVTQLTQQQSDEQMGSVLGAMINVNAAGASVSASATTSVNDTITVSKINASGLAFSTTSLTITLSGGSINTQTFGPSSNPFSVSVLPGKYTITSSVPTGYSVTYALNGSTSYTAGTSVVVNFPLAGATTSIIWKYTATTPPPPPPPPPAPAPTSTPLKVSGPSGTISWTQSTGFSPSPIFQATGGIAPYTWSVASGTLPAGVSIQAGSASGSEALAGTPTQSGTFAFALSVTDSAKPANKASAAGTLNVQLPAVPPPPPPPTPTPTSSLISQYNIIANAQADGFGYAYAPTMVQQTGTGQSGATDYAFFCSVGANGAWDYIRMTSSADGIHWTMPQIALTASAQDDTDFSACDPSLVFYDGYYYLYYSSAYKNAATGKTQTDIQVARSASIAGPYAEYIGNNTWVVNAPNPQILIQPLVPFGGRYGAGEETVVVHNGELYMWYYDDTQSGPNSMYLLTSTNPVQWTPSASAKISIAGGSVDIKYDATKKEFVMLYIYNQLAQHSSLVMSTSQNGMQWTPYQTLISPTNFPNFAANVGLLGDNQGNLLNETPLVGFGAPYGLVNELDWGQWNLYGASVNLNQTTAFNPDTTPGGALDSEAAAISTGNITGWAYDPDVPSQSINVQFYVDGPQGQGTLVATVLANVSRPDVDTVEDITGNHGFAFSLPSQFRNGVTHTLYIYADDVTAAGVANPAYNAFLTSAPLTFNLSH